MELSYPFPPLRDMAERIDVGTVLLYQNPE
jgi:hypothetical protein